MIAQQILLYLKDLNAAKKDDKPTRLYMHSGQMIVAKFLHEDQNEKNILENKWTIILEDKNEQITINGDHVRKIKSGRPWYQYFPIIEPFLQFLFYRG